MKNFLVAMLLSLFTLACVSTPQDSVEPAYDVGLEFQVPCMQHGYDTYTILSVDSVFIYEVVNGFGEKLKVSESDIDGVVND